MFKTMDNIPVYDKQDVDSIIETENNRIAGAESAITALQNNVQQLDNTKASKTSVQELENIVGTSDTTGLRNRVRLLEDTANDLSIRTHALETNSATKTELNTGLNSKADKTYAEQTRQIANNAAADIVALDGRVDTLETNSVTHAELAQEVSNVVDDIIDSKIALIMSDINTIVANAISVALQNYDTSSTVNTKISTAINTALQSYDTSSAVDTKIGNAVSAATTPMSSAEVIAVVDAYF